MFRNFLVVCSLTLASPCIGACEQHQYPILAGNAGQGVLEQIAVEDRPAPNASGTTDSDFPGTEAGEAKVLVPRVAFHWCPPGKFTMGKPGPPLDDAAVEVTLSSGFWMSETEVTQGQWAVLMETTPWIGMPQAKEGLRFAASCVSHDDAVEYCAKLTEQERKAGRLPSGWKYALPTEAQWEYACRAGSKTKFTFGDDDKRLGEYAWYHENAGKVKEEYAHEVGQKKANNWGLKDMHGNVKEWCADGYEPKLPGGRDPMGVSKSPARIYRGGAWNTQEFDCRCAYRAGYSRDWRFFTNVGFRVVAVPSSQ